MRVLGLDRGDVRTGVAVCDPDMKIATPVSVLPTNEVLAASASFRRLLEDWEPELLVCGLPVSLDGEEGHQAQHIRQMADQITKSCGIAHVFTDERMSSAEAKRTLRELGYDEKAMRGKVDMIAASLFLQAWLDSQMDTDTGR